MSDDKELEEILSIMESEKYPSQIQIQIFSQMLAEYTGKKFNEHYQRFRKLEYK